METQTLIMQLIRDYLQEVAEMKQLFRQKFGVHSFMEARAQMRQGSLSQNPKIEFDFHGAGCTLTFKDHLLSFNFEPEDGFDAWFLREYAESHKVNKYGSLVEWSALKEALELLRQKGSLSSSGSLMYQLNEPTLQPV